MAARTTKTTATKATARKAPAKAPAKAPKLTGSQLAAKTRGENRRAAKAAAAKGEAFEAAKHAKGFTCRSCGELKAVSAFPTLAGPERRGTECRACRNARRAA